MQSFHFSRNAQKEGFSHAFHAAAKGKVCQLTLKGKDASLLVSEANTAEKRQPHQEIYLENEYKLHWNENRATSEA